jgi:hypothetical protein
LSRKKISNDAKIEIINDESIKDFYKRILDLYELNIIIKERDCIFRTKSTTNSAETLPPIPQQNLPLF